MGPVAGTKNTAIQFDPQSMLSLGDKGPAVGELQQLLNGAGADLKVDSDWGPKTDQAVRDFQQQHGLKPDGIAGPKTVAALQSANSTYASSATSKHELDLNKELESPDSRLSVAIGVAEGTRTPDGKHTAAYNGHTDPVKGYNVGTFSYQGKAGSPAQADWQQLRDLKSAQPAFENACRKAGLDPSEPLLAGTFFDLYNQAPKAATGKGGLLDQLPALAKKGITPENLAQARYNSFYDPDKGKFDTGMSLSKLKADQTRRTDCLVSGLGSEGTTTPPPPGKIGLNSQGPEVAALKQALKDSGFYHGTVNDKMGKQGIDALKQAKAALHIGGPDDVAGAETIKKIQDYAKSVPNLHVNVDFVSQFDARVPGDYAGQRAGLKCDNACDYMMRHTGNVESRVVPGQDDSKVTPYLGGGHADLQVQYVQAQLRAGKPVMIGVNHPDGTAGTGNKNGINHYLVATGMGTDEKGMQYISFNDPVQTTEASGKDTNPENRLLLQNGQFVQNRSADPYRLRGVVKNQG